MLFLIIIIAIALYAILIVWSKANMNSCETEEIYRFLGIGAVIVFMISFVLVWLNPVNIDNASAQNTMNLINTLLFAPINSLILLPYMASVKNREREEKITYEGANKRRIIAVIAFALILWIESGYLKSFQTMM